MTCSRVQYIYSVYIKLLINLSMNYSNISSFTIKYKNEIIILIFSVLVLKIIFNISTTFYIRYTFTYDGKKVKI